MSCDQRTRKLTSSCVVAIPQITQKDEGKKAKSEHENLSGRPWTEMLGGPLVALLGSCNLHQLLVEVHKFSLKVMCFLFI